MGTRNLAIMSTDIVGSTTTTLSFERDEYRAFRDEYERVVRTTIESRDGRVFKSLGDGYLAAFESSTNAVLAGLGVEEQIQALTGARRWDQRSATRIGVASGDVTVEGGDCFGAPVIVATRVQSLAEPNTTWFTDSVFLSMNRKEIAYDNLGAISLKGLEDAVHLYRARPQGEPPTTVRVTALMTDTRGFTEMADASGESRDSRLERVFAAYDQLVFTYVARFGGLLRYNFTDQYLFTFAEPDSALAAAKAIVTDPESLVDRQETPVHVCAALGEGELRVIAGRHIGSLASRIMPRLIGLPSAGEIIATAELAERYATSGAATFGAVQTVHLKGSAAPLSFRTWQP